MNDDVMVGNEYLTKHYGKVIVSLFDFGKGTLHIVPLDDIEIDYELTFAQFDDEVDWDAN
mgnify:FL=1